jgi:isoamylase
MNAKLEMNDSYPLGATWDGTGTSFALFSERATSVHLCLFDDQDIETRIPLVHKKNHIWYGYFPDIKPGQKYGFRVNGPYDPYNGLHFNASKLLVDPYAKVIAGDVIYSQELFNYPLNDFTKKPTVTCLAADNAHLIPKSVVIDDSFDWENDQQLYIPWSDTIIYETHVKGFTQLDPKIPKHLRGTYAGLSHEVSIDYFQSLGITAIELLPIHHIFPCPQFLAEQGLRDYWGYRTLGYFAPYSSYSSTGVLGEQVTEFKQMVKRFHQAGIEVILDVVYNHSAEGNPSEPTLFFRGIDNEVYYKLNENNRGEYIDFTGCGNSLNVSHPQVLKLIMDSLRYWVTEMHIDGFRFDEAPTLARDNSFYDSGAAFFDIIHQDPVLNSVKLIAEAWDCGNEGYQVGNFPLLWSEWNAKYRDTMRNFWRGEHQNIKEFINCFLGSPDLYEKQGKLAYGSLNFITCHDGFTLDDLVSYNEKHNEINGEKNRDGTDNNNSWNCGVEGIIDEPEVLALREKQKRNLLVTLLLSKGVPMILGGDEIGRTQQGNNNAYNQDNEISWFNWDLMEENKQFLEFTKQLIQVRKQYELFSQTTKCKTLYFFPNGDEIISTEVESGNMFSILLQNLKENPRFLLLFNGHYEDGEFLIPASLGQNSWQIMIDTNKKSFSEQELLYQNNNKVLVQQRSLIVLVSKHT